MKEKELRVGDKCPQCDAVAEKRVCSVCGIERIEIDCGHFEQPQFISAGYGDGKELYHDFCEDCSDKLSGNE